MEIEQLRNPRTSTSDRRHLLLGAPDAPAAAHRQGDFLDTRWYSKDPGDASPLLGQKQLDYLKQELANEQGYVLICAGMPIRATGNGWMPYRDDYAKFREIIYSAT